MYKSDFNQSHYDHRHSCYENDMYFMIYYIIQVCGMFRF